MHVSFRATVGGAKQRYRMTAYEAADLDYCCDRMAHEYGDLVRLGVDGFPRVENLSLAVATTVIQGDGDALTALTPIGYCPWCGDRIVFEPVPDSPAQDGPGEG